MDGYFVNHEVSKIAVPGPDIITAVYAVFLLSAVLTLRKTGTRGFLDFVQTGQMKGLAILLIFTGHINHIVPVYNSLPNLAAMGVAVFLFCSGYGLVSSSMKQDYSLKEFLLKRCGKVYVPYWAVTVVVLAADTLLLSKSYTAVDITATMLGINFNESTRHIDYVRWFITYILLMYVLFFVSLKSAKSWKARAAVLWSLVLCMDVAFILGGGVLPAYVYYSLMFPTGVLVAVYHEDVSSFFDKAVGTAPLRGLSLLAPFVFLACKYTLLDPLIDGQGQVAMQFASRQLLLFVFVSLLLWAMSSLRLNGYESLLLTAVGGVSYELFLLHGIFMVKYDFLLYRGAFIFWFLVFTAFAFLTAYILNRLVSQKALAFVKGV